jgi:hypothetical protein
MGDWITNLHGPTYKTATRAEGKGGEFPNVRELYGRSLTPLSGLRLVFAALAGEDRSGAVHRAERAMRRTIR